MSRLLTSIYPSTSFDVSYTNYSRFLTFTDKHAHETVGLAETLPAWLPPGSKVTAIDVGAGSGRLARTVCDIYGGERDDFSLTLLEPAENAAEALRQDFGGQFGVDVVCRSLQDLSSDPSCQRYSLVLASHVNYYFPDRQEFFDTMLDLVKPSGLLCCISGSISLVDHPFYRVLGLRVDVLQAAQDLRNVVSRLGVQIDRAYVHAIKRHLGVEHTAHGFWIIEVFGQDTQLPLHCGPRKFELTYEIVFSCLVCTIRVAQRMLDLRSLILCSTY